MDDFRSGLLRGEYALRLTLLAMTAGYMFWMVSKGDRQGVSSQLPAWQLIDPLRVFDAAAAGWADADADAEDDLEDFF